MRKLRCDQQKAWTLQILCRLYPEYRYLFDKLKNLQFARLSDGVAINRWCDKFATHSNGNCYTIGNGIFIRLSRTEIFFTTHSFDITSEIDRQFLICLHFMAMGDFIDKSALLFSGKCQTVIEAYAEVALEIANTIR